MKRFLFSAIAVIGFLGLVPFAQAAISFDAGFLGTAGNGNAVDPQDVDVVVANDNSAIVLTFYTSNRAMQVSTQAGITFWDEIYSNTDTQVGGVSIWCTDGVDAGTYNNIEYSSAFSDYVVGQAAVYRNASCPPTGQGNYAEDQDHTNTVNSMPVNLQPDEDSSWLVGVFSATPNNSPVCTVHVARAFQGEITTCDSGGTTTGASWFLRVTGSGNMKFNGIVFELLDYADLPTSPQVIIKNPADGDEFVNPDFQSFYTSWRIGSYDSDITASTPGKIAVWYGTSTSTMTHLATTNITREDENVDYPNINRIVRTDETLSPGDWYAYAVVYDYRQGFFFGDVIATSPVVHFETDEDAPVAFDILGGFNQIPNASTSLDTDSSSPFFVDCSAYEGTGFWGTSISPGGIYCFMKKLTYGVFGWAMVPPPTFMSDFKRSFDFSDVLPLNIVYGVRDRIDVAGRYIIDTATTTPETLSVSFLGHETDLITPTLLEDNLTTPTCDGACASEQKDFFFSWLKVALWVGGALGALALIL